MMKVRKRKQTLLAFSMCAMLGATGCCEAYLPVLDSLFGEEVADLICFYLDGEDETKIELE
jgi:hypothetical protein